MSSMCSLQNNQRIHKNIRKKVKLTRHLAMPLVMVLSAIFLCKEEGTAQGESLVITAIPDRYVSATCLTKHFQASSSFDSYNILRGQHSGSYCPI